MDVYGFGELMLDEMPFEPTEQQIKLTAALARFCSAQTPSDTVFILNGYAGTGKTSVMVALVRSLRKVGLNTVLLASTGRAAKVLSGFTGFPAYTIHRKIYSSDSFSPDGFSSGAKINRNPHVNTFFIVDEASMIGEGNDGGLNLLQDLAMYVYTGVNCKLILLGDTAQLPPVGSSQSPAMTAEAFRKMGLKVTRATITSTVRQQKQSGILYNATWLRRAMSQWQKATQSQPVEPPILPSQLSASPSQKPAEPPQLPEPQITVSPFDDVELVSPEELEDSLGQSFAEFGQEQTIMITRSNRRAVDFNMAIRRQIFEREEILTVGDRLLIAKNNYYWPARERARRLEEIRAAMESSGSDEVAALNERCGALPDFLANGEVAEVEAIYATDTRDTIIFADVRLHLPDSDSSLDAKIVLDSLTSETAALPYEKLEAIGRRTLQEAAQKAANPLGQPAQLSMARQRAALKECPYYNALQVKYAYAVTCHKAQGGQWQSVFVDMGYIPPEAYRTLDFYRWLYTSVTRATTRLSLVNPSCKIV